MSKTTTTKTFKKGDVSVKITVTDAHNMSAGKSAKKSTRKKSNKRRRRKSDGGDIFYF